MRIGSIHDYYPFGWEKQLTTVNAYPFNYQGQLFDRELGWQYYRYRNYDPMIARFYQVEPLVDKYPWLGYVFSENKVVYGVEIEGLEAEVRVYVAERFYEMYKEGELVKGYKQEGSSRLRGEWSMRALSYLDCSELVTRVLFIDDALGREFDSDDPAPHMNTAGLKRLFTESGLYERVDVPRPGDIFIWRGVPEGESRERGHTGIVVDYDPVTDTVTIVHAKGRDYGIVREKKHISYFTKNFKRFGWGGFFRPKQDREFESDKEYKDFMIKVKTAIFEFSIIEVLLKKIKESFNGLLNSKQLDNASGTGSSESN